MKQKYAVIGMTCSACQSNVERSVKKLKGVSNVNVNLITNTMTLDIKDNLVNNETIINSIRDVGYDAKIINNEGFEKVSDNKKEINIKTRLIISIIFSTILMYIAMGNMFEWPLPSALNAMEKPATVAFLQFLLVLPVIYFNQTYFYRGFKGLIKKSPNMDTLLALGSTAAMLYGIFAIFMIAYGYEIGNHEIYHKYVMALYFEVPAAILTLVTVGKFIENNAKDKTTNAIKRLLALLPKKVNIVENETTIEIAIEDLSIGNKVLVKPGEIIPVDGIILEGSSSLDQSFITGESTPVSVTVNSKVVAGALNLDGVIMFSATKIGKDTTLSKIIELVEVASSSKAPISKLADQISAVFVPIVIAISILSFIVWLAVGAPFEMALEFAIAVLVISCPCALGLATPVAIMVATGKSAENGAIIKSAEALEIAHKINTVIFDKTGTITEGKLKVSKVIDLTNEKNLLELAAAIEQNFNHPIAKAIKDSAASTLKLEFIDLKNYPGLGVKASLKDNYYLLGNKKFINENNVNGKLDEFEQVSSSTVFVSKNQTLIGVIFLEDSIKETSILAISAIKKLGIETIMLTGDNKATALKIAQAAGIDKVEFDLLPADKDRVIETLQKQGKTVAMVGDGINDAPALMRADVGIAIGAGTDIAIESSDIILARNNLEDVYKTLLLSRKTINNIKQNLFWAFIYNIVGIPLAAGVFYGLIGWKLSPVYAAFAMSISSVSVVFNASRLRLFKIKE